MSATPPGFAATVRLLLSHAQRRERARLRANAKRAANPSGVFALSVIAMLLMYVVLGWIYAVQTREIADVVAERDGKLTVSARLIDELADVARAREAGGAGAAHRLSRAEDALSRQLEREARGLERRRGGERADWRAELDRRLARDGGASFVPEQRYGSGMAPVGAPLLSVLLVLWWLSLALQGEHLGFDVARRRHPMWEWYLRFPVSNTAVFVAEALAPIATNPILLTAPVLLATVAGWYERSLLAAFAALPVAVPLIVAAAIWSKALEALVMLRCKPRNRAVWLALLTGTGIAALSAPVVVAAAGNLAHRTYAAIWPWLETLPAPTALIGTGSVGGWLVAMTTSLALGAVLAAPAALAMRAATARGIEGGFGDDSAAPSRLFERRGGGRFLGDPLWRKDLLWLLRDRGALFQTIAAPLALAALQLFNFRFVLIDASVTWNHLAGLVVGFAAYMLFAAGPRALASEGPALVLTLSWPRSLEDTLRTKVRLLFALVSLMVYACFAMLLWMFPRDWLGLLLVAAAWPLFGLAVAEKAVSLVQAPSQSGVVEAPPPARAFLAGLGNLTFAIGVYNAQWNIAIVAIVLNWVFAGALWQTFRHRLAYLFDRDSEPALRPPTIVSSAVAIVGLMELGVVVSLPLLLAVGKDGALFALTFGYGVAALVVTLATLVWHRRQDVELGDLIALDARASNAPAAYCLAAVALGAGLAAVALGYERLLFALPWPSLHESLENSRVFLQTSPRAKLMLFVLAVGFAPWVEEFLFRGLMFRAMLPQWGVARATIASSALFAILHAPPYWPMIFALGAACALLFWRSRALLPCVLLHVTYNALVVLAAG